MSSEPLGLALGGLQTGGANREEVKKSLAVVEEAARAEGLPPNALVSLTAFIAARSTNSTLLSRAVRSLIPRSLVPSLAVLRLLGSLKGQTLPLRLLIIRWIILIYDIIDNQTNLHAIYGALFHFLQYDDLRPAVCQLLCYMTRRQDVVHYRVQSLTELSKRVGDEREMVALLVLYHTLCPHMLSCPQHSRRKKVWFGVFEKQLASDIRRVQKARQSDNANAQESTSTRDHLHKQLTSAPPPLKKAKGRYSVSALSLATSRVTRKGERGQRVDFESLTTHRQLCENITEIEFPGQVAGVLKSRLFQHMFSANCEPSAVIRFTYWLEHSLGYELDCYRPGHSNSDLQSLLADLYTLTQFIQEPIPTVESFLHILLEEWNGDDYRHEILNLLSHLSLQPFDDLEKAFLIPLRRLFLSKDREFKYQCLACFSQMLKNMAIFEWPRHQNQAASASHRYSLFSPMPDEEMEDFNPLATINWFIKFVDYLILVALEQEKQQVLLYHAGMEFYRVAADLPRVYNIHHLSLPSASVLISGLFGHSTYFISSACAHLVKVKENLSALSKNERSLRLTQTFNSLVLDFCNALWRDMIFRETARNSEYPTLCFDLPREELKMCAVTQPHKRLNLVHHPAMIGFALKFLTETQDADILDQLVPSAIWQETRFKQAYLQFLTQSHLSGIADFIRTFIHTK